MATHDLSRIVSGNGDIYLIKAKGLEDQIKLSLTGDVSGQVTTDMSGNASISTTIANGAVGTAKLSDSAVTTGKIADKAVTLDKIADSAKGGAVQDNDGVLATHSQVKNYVDSVVAGEGKYRGIQTVATINTWTASNLNNGDSVITEDAGTITLGNFAVVSNQELIFWKDAESQVWQTSEGNYKLKQTAKTDPTASGTTITAIDTITQNSNGDITATKKTIRGATTSQTGVVQLASSIGATVASENNKAATEKAVRDAINALDSNKTSTDGTNVQVKVTETDGKISAVNITADNTENRNNKVTAWSETTTDVHYPSEKLVKSSLDGKASSTHTHGNITNDGKIGSTANLAVVTGTSGAVTTADLTTASPTVPTSGTTTSLEFIDTVAQDSKGKIRATKKAVPVDSTYSSTGTNPVNGKAIAAAIGGLDSNKTSTDGTNVQVKVTETDGKISAVNVTTDNTENKNNKVSKWQTTPDNTHYPSEKLVKDGLDAKADADKVVAIADARIDRNGTDGWFKIASKAFNSNGTDLKFQWIVSALGYADNSQNVTFFLNLTIGFGSSGSNPYIGRFETSPIKKGSIGCDFKTIVNGTVGNATIELWAKVGSRYGSVAIRELQAGNFRGADAKGFLTYASYSPSDAGSSEEPNGNVSKKQTFVYVQEVIASPTKDNLVAMDANGLVKDSGLAKSSVESAISKAGSAIQGVKVNGTTLTPDANKIVTVPLATKSADGAMSAADKTKLDGIAAGTASPLMDGKASVGNSLKYAREDHVHPSDTSREDIANKTTVVLGTSDSKYPTDKAVAEFVNSSIATNTANYISNNGEPFTSVAQLEAYSGPVTNNDYAFVTGIDSEGNTYYDRYKATVSGSTVTWALEYRLNNSSFTAAQWSAINSGITSVLVAKIHDHSNKDVLDGITSDKVNSWDGKEDAFEVLSTTKGGTGTNAASKSALTSSLINSLSTESSKPVDADYYVSQYKNGGTSNTSFVRKPVSALWEYIKDKISSVLRLTASDYAGKAATAGTADKAVADNSGNNIVNTYATKTELNAKGLTIKEISGEQVICFE